MENRRKYSCICELHDCEILLLLNVGSCHQIYLRPSAHAPVTHLSSRSFGTAALAAGRLSGAVSDGCAELRPTTPFPPELLC